MKTSFVIIAYNEELTIGRCLKSILEQNNLFDYEIIVVNDGSRDKTAQVVKTYATKNSRIILHTLIPNQGRGAARSAGVKMAKGEYIAFVDADIVLPAHWLETCFSYMDRFDAVSGIAIPDGDVNYVYTYFNLCPKAVHHSTTITGSNGLYKRVIFQKINFDNHLRDGEDVALNHLMNKNNFRVQAIDSLIVEHRESKSFKEASRWLYQSGLGATRQLKQFREIRLPDLAYLCFLIVLIMGIGGSLYFKNFVFLLSPIPYVFLVSLMHLRKKFVFQSLYFLNYIAAVFLNSIFLACYFFGRTVGWLISVPMCK